MEKFVRKGRKMSSISVYIIVFQLSIHYKNPIQPWSQVIYQEADNIFWRHFWPCFAVSILDTSKVGT